MDYIISKPLVSICCTAYNLEKYIAEAIDSFLMQETSFNFEIIVGEDCSTDSTRNIIKNYQQKFPNIIRIISSDKNVGVIKNYNRVIEAAKGKYLAICDGDDFWSSNDKLQKQVDFLESNDEYVICCHYSEVVDASGNLKYVDPNPVALEYTYDDLIFERRRETRNSTMVIRNCEDFRQITQKEWFLRCHVQDTSIKLFATYITGKKIVVLPEVMGKYRIHNSSSWSTINAKVRKIKAREDFVILIENFKYNKDQKQGLLNLYSRNYLISDLRKLNFINAAKVLKALIF
jgi:glycosyltransferase involved in cell wall biosynthesis